MVGVYSPLTDLDTRHVTSILPSICGTDPTCAIKPCNHCKKNPTTTDGDSEVTHTCNQGAHYHHVGSHCASKVEKKKYDIIKKFWEIQHIALCRMWNIQTMKYLPKICAAIVTLNKGKVWKALGIFCLVLAQAIHSKYPGITPNVEVPLLRLALHM